MDVNLSSRLKIKTRNKNLCMVFIVFILEKSMLQKYNYFWQHTNAGLTALASSNPSRANNHLKTRKIGFVPGRERKRNIEGNPLDVGRQFGQSVLLLGSVWVKLDAESSVGV